MKYPIPDNYELYYNFNPTQREEHTHNTINTNKQNNFSRSKKNKYIDEYIKEINRLSDIFKSIPFIDKIYLCNSITFNALKENSDIDLLIVSQPGRIRSTKLRSMILFFINGTKRYGKNTRKRICLSFFITSDSLNLYSICIPGLDIYLCYRISHLVLLYEGNNMNKKNNIFIQNKRIKGVLPNYQEKQTIYLGTTVLKGDTKIKRIIEFFGNGVVGDFLEFIAKRIQKPIIIIKNNIRKTKNKDVIISDNMLKFHKDIRCKISFKYNLKTK